MFPEESGTLYRWESEDLVISKKAKNITDSELRNFITPKVTIIAQRSQMIFGVRFGFSVNQIFLETIGRNEEHFQT